MNRVFLMGHLGKDPDLGYTGGGKSVCKFRMATSERYQNKDGEWKDSTEWHNIVVWGRQAEACGEYLNKGSRVHVEGSIKTRSWEGRDGQKRWTTEITAVNVIFLDSRATTRGADHHNGGYAGHDRHRERSQHRHENDYPEGHQPAESPRDEDIPF